MLLNGQRSAGLTLTSVGGGQSSQASERAAAANLQLAPPLGFRVVPAGRPFATARRRPCRLLARSCCSGAGFAPAAVCAIAAAPACCSCCSSNKVDNPDQQHPAHSRPHPSSLESTLDNASATPTPTRTHTRPFSPARPLPTQPFPSSPGYGR